MVTIVGGFSSTIYLGSASAQSTTLKESTGIKGTITNVTKVNIVLVHGLMSIADEIKNFKEYGTPQLIELWLKLLR